MGRPKSKEVETVENVIAKMHAAGELTAATKPKDVSAKLSAGLAKKMDNRISPLLQDAKRRHGLVESDAASGDWRREMRRLVAKVEELGGVEKVKGLVAESDEIDNRQRELEKQLRLLGGVTGAKLVLADLVAVGGLFAKKP